MQGKPEITFLIVIGVIAMLVLTWGDTHPQYALHTAVTPAATPVSYPEAVGTERTRSAIFATELQRQFTRLDVRTDEAVLLFKNALGYQHFLARYDHTGLQVLGKIDPLFSVRIRVLDYHALSADLLVHANDYERAAANTLAQTAATPENQSLTTGAAGAPKTNASTVPTSVADVAPGIRISDINTVDAFTAAQAVVHAVDTGAKLITLGTSTGAYVRSAIFERAVTYASAHHVVILMPSLGDTPAQPIAP